MGIYLEYKPEKPTNPYRLGRHREHDDKNKRCRTGYRVPQYKSVIWPDAGPVLDQGDIGSCTGDTVADILNTDMFAPVRQAKNSGQYLSQAQAYEIYSAATHISAIGGGQMWPPNDVGSTGPAAAQAAENYGYFDRFSHCFGWDDFQATLETQPVMLGTDWTSAMFKYDSDGVVTVGSINDYTLAGGHEYMARGILQEKNLVLCRNHWDTAWNPKTVGPKMPGEFYITFDDMQKLLASGGDVTVPHGTGMP